MFTNNLDCLCYASRKAIDTSTHVLFTWSIITLTRHTANLAHYYGDHWSFGERHIFKLKFELNSRPQLRWGLEFKASAKHTTCVCYFFPVKFWDTPSEKTGLDSHWMCLVPLTIGQVSITITHSETTLFTHNLGCLCNASRKTLDHHLYVLLICSIITFYQTPKCYSNNTNLNVVHCFMLAWL